ncbi:PRD domain-containing protein [Saccharibacillus alkalitolerans]|uniref:PRD domain-containing protein n=1 Tax=Saccharibacillus alkalitolerans TaxID=2705290 RepID=A0ABX0F811_9BACL|nr:PRD domain-containing protein [Saccharibacillus alkalitolerans]NGZ77107.1 PRD domain-containing protein [Saccharibacillus alkalitolerans]
MRITQIINDHMVVAEEEQAGEAGYRSRTAQSKEGELLFGVLENAFGAIERRFGIKSGDVSELTYRRFAEHLRTSVRRAAKAEERETATDGTLGELIRTHMPECYKCADEIRSDLERRCGTTLPEDELLDLMLHVHKVISGTAKSRA